jgi:hypothetical protein
MIKEVTARPRGLDVTTSYGEMRVAPWGVALDDWRKQSVVYDRTSAVSSDDIQVAASMGVRASP